MKEKRCFKCGEIKPLSEFYINKGMKDGRLNKCKDCSRADTIKNRNNKIEKYREYDRIRGKSKERVNARKEYYEKNKNKHGYKASRLKANNKYRNDNPEKARAHRMLGYNVRNGIIKKEPCIICGSLKTQAHHEDYSKPLDVVWLCEKHHKERHVETQSFRKE